MTAREVITLLRSLHRPTTWSLSYYTPRRGCVTCGAHKTFSEVTWPCETAALLDQIEKTLIAE